LQATSEARTLNHDNTFTPGPTPNTVRAADGKASIAMTHEVNNEASLYETADLKKRAAAVKKALLMLRR